MMPRYILEAKCKDKFGRVGTIQKVSKDRERLERDMSSLIRIANETGTRILNSSIKPARALDIGISFHEHMAEALEAYIRYGKMF